MFSRIPLGFVVLVASIAALSSCDRDKPTTGTNGVSKPVAAVQPKNILEFPAELRVQDDAINGMVEKAMSACASGDYNLFRGLWSVREEPLSREEFEEGWKAVREIRIRALQKIRIDMGADNDNRSAEPGGEVHYVVLASVVFDPTLKATQKEPEREVVLLVIPEQGEWRVARAPKSIREWIHQQLSTKPVTGGP